jgi:hypothetical protein
MHHSSKIFWKITLHVDPYILHQNQHVSRHNSRRHREYTLKSPLNVSLGSSGFEQ